MSKHLLTLLVASIMAAAGAPVLFAQEGEETQGQEAEKPQFTEEKVSVYGYLTDYLNANVYESDPRTDVGNIAYLRLKGDFKPQDGLAFHVEGFYSLKTGNQNPDVILLGYGYPLPSTKTQEIIIDHAWGVASFGNLDLQFGKVPIGWGTGYIFNPTQRAAVSDFINPVVEETPGTLALQPTWSVSESLNLTGYLAFQDRSHRDTVAVKDGRWENLPLGVKAQFVAGKFDFSASIIKEVLYLEETPGGDYFYRRTWFVGADAAGAVWNFGVYAEAALRLPTNRGGTEWDPSGFNFFRALEAVAGFDYTFSALDDLELRVEYYHQGPGEADKARYDVMKIQRGEQLVLGKDYLFGRLAKKFLDLHEATLSCIVNLHDGSLGLLPEVALDAYDNLSVKIGAQVFWGPSGSEFNGEYDLSYMGLGVIDVTPAAIYAAAKLSF